LLLGIPTEAEAVVCLLECIAPPAENATLLDSTTAAAGLRSFLVRVVDARSRTIIGSVLVLLVAAFALESRLGSAPGSLASNELDEDREDEDTRGVNLGLGGSDAPPDIIMCAENLQRFSLRKKQKIDDTSALEQGVEICNGAAIVFGGNAPAMDPRERTAYLNSWLEEDDDQQRKKKIDVVEEELEMDYWKDFLK
jgi:hypothetical protein